MVYNYGMAGNVDTQIDDYIKALHLVRKKPSVRNELIDVSKTNLAIVNDLMSRAKSLKSRKQYKEASHMLAVAQKILDNNKRLQTAVGRVSDDS